MPYSETESIVLKKFRYGDTSLIATLFTKEFGKFNAIIKGARSIKSKYSGIFDPINHIKIILNKKENRELQVISKAEVLNPYQNIKKEIEKLLISFRILELINKLFYQYDKSESTFSLLKDTLNFLNESKIDSSLVLLYFQTKLSKSIGISLAREKQNNIIQDETFNYYGQYKIDRNDFEYLQNLYKQEFNSLQKFEIDCNRMYNLIDFMDTHLLSNYYTSNTLLTKRSIFQIENFKLKHK
ncbi:MAG: DNA repair protein RecO [Ignavibacteria bacterium]|nr:DNA repair protein RecO [Ignavibacteria bacterium]